MSEDAIRQHVEQKAQTAKAATAKLRALSSAVKDAAILAMADAVRANSQRIFEENKKDLIAGKEKGLSGAMLDRLELTPKRIDGIVESCQQVAALPDPVNRVIDGWSRPNGLKLERVRTPLGVIGIIYESRPNVTVETSILCLKSGNSVILRGGSEAFHSNKILWEVISEAAVKAGVPEGAIEFIETTDRAATTILAQMEGTVDLLIPRGGEKLKAALSKVAKVPVIYAAGGVCHAFVDASADLQQAQEIVFNAKVQRCSVCNALETLLVQADIAQVFLPAVIEKFQNGGVEIRGDERTQEIVPGISAATEDDWSEEYNAMVLSVKVLDDLDEAIAHIEKYGTHHSDVILTRDYASAERFCNEVDSAAVYVNASTRFTDGFEFGLGAEIGISTQKLHARGPLGLEALTTFKYVVRGQGQIRE